MKKALKKVLAPAILALTCSIAFAQEPKNPAITLPGGVTALPLIMPCSKSQIIFDLLEGDKYKESPIALGNSNIFRPDNVPVPGQLTMWYNADKRNFSIVFTIGGSDISCIISSGTGMELIPAYFGEPI
jgi:hypothetical protein